MHLQPPKPERHLLSKIRKKKSWAKDDPNTVVEDRYWEAVKQDVEALNRGEGKRVNEEYHINGRRYGREDKRFFPIAGEGFHPLSRAEYKALMIYGHYFYKYGNVELAVYEINRAGLIQEAKRAFALWQLGQEQKHND